MTIPALAPPPSIVARIPPGKTLLPQTVDATSRLLLFKEDYERVFPGLTGKVPLSTPEELTYWASLVVQPRVVFGFKLPHGIANP